MSALTAYAHTPDAPKPKIRTGLLRGLTEVLAEQRAAVEEAGDDDVADRVLTGRIPLTREQRQQALEELVRSGVPDHVIRANAALEQMARGDTTNEDIGPPAPSDLPSAVKEVADMIEALAAWGGEAAVKEAVTTGLARFFGDTPSPQRPQPVLTEEPDDVQPEPTP